MKKFGFMMMAAAIAAFTFTSCKGGDTPQNLDDIVENGFYVVGEAAALPQLDLKGQMGAGYNEANSNEKRDGMYEKYIVLEAGKKFHFAKKEGDLLVNYGANLTADSLVTDYLPIAGYKGALAENVEMEVAKTGLYHIILDFDVDEALKNVGGPQIVIAEVKWGVSGGMNNWSWTECPVEVVAGQETITWNWKDQELAAGGKFKFKNNSAWKIELDDAGFVKANSNLGAECLQGGPDIVVEEAGLYDITLTFNLKGGEVKDSYAFEAKLTQKSELPTTMYIIGNDFGNWAWDSEGVVEMVPVHSNPGMFWAVRYMTTDTEFKFCAQKAWNGDFTGLDTNEGFITPGNNKVEADGLYTIIVDLKNSKVTVAPAAIYGMGDCFGSWDAATYAFEVAADGTASIVTTAAGQLRMYVAVGAEWWQSEFIILNGEIAYRGDGDDQERVEVAAGATVTLDFNAGTGAIQ